VKRHPEFAPPKLKNCGFAWITSGRGKPYCAWPT